ncbi:MAG TPA: DEAD/DEAH box helicase [Stellaceae bacterium]|nr:DEAD/DEAH box helicase [Stellaceae bacterium]
MTNFSDFGLAVPILQALATEGYETPTPIQAQAIPHILGGRDLCGIAQTGTGKTAAFALPILHRLAAIPARRVSRGCRVLVLSPTRELASQIADNFRAYGRQLRLSTAVVFGGVSLVTQQRQLASGVDILVATPGRLLDLIDRRDLSLATVEVLVLDEADRMLDLGFIHALRRIVKLLPRERQTLLFSATMPRTIAALAEDYLKDPVKVAVTPVATTVERVDQGVVFVPMPQKRVLLASLLRDPAFERVLVFTRTKHGADRVVRHLLEARIEAIAIHGNKSQPQRERALAGFRAGHTRVLVATDIAARGIDVEAVSHVINFELPNVPEDYVHRIGRTARAGAAGIAISFCDDDERPYLRDIEKLTRLKLKIVPLPADLPAASRAEPSEPRPPLRAAQRAAPRPHAGRGRQAPGNRPASANAQPAAPANHSRASAQGQRASAGNENGLPAFLRRDGGAGQSPRSSWRQRGAGRKVGGRAGGRTASP